MTRRILLGICVTLCLAVATPAPIAGEDGRWKDDGNGGCYFDPDDSGPDQCWSTPGRWKDDGNGGCYYDASDSGPNQCQPPADAAR